MSRYPGCLRQRYPELRGRDWLRRIPPEDRRAWAFLGRLALAERSVNWQRLGGQTRAKQAQRDRRGRFLPAPKRESNT
jgi:hypothetical protein